MVTPYVSRSVQNALRILAIMVIGAIFIGRPSQAHAQCAGSEVSLSPCPTSATVDPTTVNTKTVVVHNKDRYESISVTASCSHTGQVASCSVSPSSFTIAKNANRSVTVTYTASATYGSGSVVFSCDDASETISVTVQHVQNFTIDLDTVNATDKLLGLCAQSCFAGTAVFNTVPFFTMDTPRNVTLVYTEDRAHPRPFVYADITTVAHSDTATKYTLEATLNGAQVTFLNGDTKLYFSSRNGIPVRLAGQFDASSYSTGAYPLIVTVTAIYSDAATVSHSYTKHLVIVNEASSPIARGWTIAGVQHLYTTTDGYVITNGDGSATYFPGVGLLGDDFTSLSYDSVGLYYTRTYVDSSKAFFTGSTGNMYRFQDRLGRTLEYGYSGSSVTSIVDPIRQARGGVGTYILLSYGTHGLASISESGGTAGRTTTVTVDGSRNLTTMTDPDSDSTQYNYDSNNRLTSVTDRRGGVTTYAYDSNSWKLHSVTLPQIPVDAGGGGTTNATPKITYTPWQPIGVPTTATSTSSLATPTVPDDVYAQVIDPMGRTTTFTVDRWGQPRVITDPASRVTTIKRSGYLPIMVTYPSGGVATTTYLSGTPLMSYYRSAGDSVVYFHYGAKAQVDSVWGPGLPAERRFLDSATGRVDSVRFSGADSTIAKYAYDSLQRDTLFEDAGQHITRYRYDPVFGNLDSTISPGNILSIRHFDVHGRDSTMWVSGSPIWSAVSYDAMNRVHASWHVGRTNDSTITTYDALYPVHVQSPGGQVNKFEVNALGWVTKRYDVADTTLSISYRYDSAGRVTSFTNRRGQLVNQTYDVLDRLLTRSGTNIPADTFSYSWNGLVTSGARGGLTRDSIYMSVRGDPTALVHQISGHSYRIAYAYQEDSIRSRRTVTITSNTSIPFSTETDVIQPGATTRDSIYLSGGGGAGGTQFAINPDGLPIWTDWPQNGATDPRLTSYTALHQPYWQTFNYGILGDSLNRGVTRDLLGRIVFDVRYSNPAAYAVSRGFSFDTLGQLLKVDWKYRYSCSASQDSILGNTYICGTPTTALTQDSSTYDEAGNRYVSGAGYSAHGNRLTTWPGHTYTYDVDGNLVTRTHGSVTDTLFWNAIDQLDSLHSGGLRVGYDYDAFGHLTRRRHNGTVDRYFLWNGTQLIAELAGSGTSRIAQYVYHGGTDQAYAMVTDSNGTSLVRYFAQDLEGNVIGVMRNLTIPQYTTYTAWGIIEQRTPNTLADTNRLGWKGLMYEGDSTKLYYVRNRWYDPTVGRFISEDLAGLAGGTNFYVFSGNDPINGWDPLGLDPWELPAVTVYGNPERSLPPDMSGITIMWGVMNDMPDIPRIMPAGRAMIPREGGTGRKPRSSLLQRIIHPNRSAACLATAADAALATAEDIGILLGAGEAIWAARGIKAGVSAALDHWAVEELVGNVEKAEARTAGQNIIRGGMKQVQRIGQGAMVAAVTEEDYSIKDLIRSFIPGVNMRHAITEAKRACYE